MFQTSVSDILLLKPFMSNFGPAPSRITMKISPSLEPRSHLSSVRFDGCVPSGAIGPSPCASAPWQKRQFFWKTACPALIDSGDDATGFLSFLPASLPPGFCAAEADASRRANVKPGMIAKAVVTRRMFTRLLYLRKNIGADSMPKAARRAGRTPSPAAYRTRNIAFGERKGRKDGKAREDTRSAGHDDRDFLVGHERAVVGAAAQDVGAGLAEAHGDRLTAVGGNRRRRPLRRPRGVGAGARVLPRLHLRRIEDDLRARGLAVDEPRHVQAEILAGRDARRRRHARA